MMDAEEFAIQLIDEHHDNIDGDPAGDGGEIMSANADEAFVSLRFTDGVALNITIRRAA